MSKVLPRGMKRVLRQRFVYRVAENLATTITICIRLSGGGTPGGVHFSKRSIRVFVLSTSWS